MMKDSLQTPDERDLSGARARLTAILPQRAPVLPEG
jgi:hypothetical protein